MNPILAYNKHTVSRDYSSVNTNVTVYFFDVVVGEGGVTTSDPLVKTDCMQIQTLASKLMPPICNRVTLFKDESNVGFI